RKHEDPVAAILSVEPGKVLFKGKVADIERRATEGFLRGRTRFDGMDEWRGPVLELNFQNEWIVAWLDTKPIAMSPDLLCVLDSVAGGGGNPYLPLLNMRALYKEGRRVQLIDAADLGDGDLVALIASMGAPLVGQERLGDSLTPTRAVLLMERHIGKRFAALMSVEIGGGNGVRPLMVAAHLRRPVVDSDTMGRAYPEAQMSSVAVGELEPCPLAAVDVRGLESIVHKVPTWKWKERVARKICV